MNIFKHTIKSLSAVFVMAFAAMFMASCQDEGYEDVSGTEAKTLWEVISTRSDLSEFAKVLKANGYDELLSSSGTFTVLAPSNSAFSPADSKNLSEVPAAHIALFGYNASALSKMDYLTMLNERQVKLSDMNLSDEEIVCRNGFLRFAGVSEAHQLQLNIYEQLMNIAADEESEYNEMASFIVSLGDSVMDTEASVQIGIDPTTNQPIYDTVMIYHNDLFEYVPLNNNDSLVTLVLLDNDSWNALNAKYWNYMKQHVTEASANYNPRMRYPVNDLEFIAGRTFMKIDTLQTNLVTSIELVKDLTCEPEGAQLHNSINNPGVVGQVYTSRTGIEITMDTATVSEIRPAANGEIHLVSGAGIKLRNNKIKDVYIEGEDFYYTNETYVAKLVDPKFRGSRYVKTYGIDSLRMYDRYVLHYDTIFNEDGTVKEVYPNGREKDANGNDLIEHVAAQQRYVYNTSQYCTPVGGSVLGYKANLFACNYKVQWRHVVPGNQGSNYCNPDTLDVDYPKYLENPNWPVGGVMRHIQKMYLSQPGDAPLEYTSNVGTEDFVKNPYNYDSFGSYTFYRCLTDYDSTAVISTKASEDEVGAKGAIKWKRMGINAGVGIDDPTFETPLIWCETSKDHADGIVDEFGVAQASSYLSGIIGVSSVTSWRYNNNTGFPNRCPRDIFMCLYNGEATIFVTSNPFGTSNAKGSTNNYYGSIFLDYIHFIPVIEEED